MFLSRLFIAVVLFAAAMLGTAAYAVGTAAGVTVSNTASADYIDIDSGVAGTASATRDFQVAELLDVSVVANDAGNVSVLTPATNRVLSFTVTNAGNGSEAFVLSTNSAVAGDQFDPSNVRIYLDANNDGLFDILVDTLYVAGVNDPVIAADGILRVFVVSDIPAGRANNDTALVQLRTESVTAATTPALDVAGTAFVGLGTGGVDAVVGSTQAVATAQRGYVVLSISTTLTKAQAVASGALNGTDPIVGAVITYTLIFTVSGSGSLAGAQINDPIPAGSTYQAGSLRLNTALQSDGIDLDAGNFSANQINVLLGTVTAPATHTVTFNVTIN